VHAASKTAEQHASQCSHFDAREDAGTRTDVWKTEPGGTWPERLHAAAADPADNDLAAPRAPVFVKPTAVA
jgi:hypothetical protein